MDTSDYELSHPFSLRRPRRTAASVPFTGDVDAWLIQLEVSTSFDADRLRDRERWQKASDREHGEALVSLLSVADAVRGQIRPKPPLRVCFPYPYRLHQQGGPLE